MFCGDDLPQSSDGNDLDFDANADAELRELLNSELLQNEEGNEQSGQITKKAECNPQANRFEDYYGEFSSDDDKSEDGPEWYEKMIERREKQTKLRLNDLSKMLCCDFVTKEHIQKLEKNHNTPLCKLDLPVHPPFRKPWRNGWKFTCSTGCKESSQKVGHACSVDCEVLRICHKGINVVTRRKNLHPNEFPDYVIQAVEIFHQFAESASKHDHRNSNRSSKSALKKPTWTSVELRSNHKHELMMVVYGKGLVGLVNSLRRFYTEESGRSSSVISVWCVNKESQDSQKEVRPDVIKVFGLNELIDRIGLIELNYTTETNIKFNSLQAYQLAKVMYYYLNPTPETTVLELGGSTSVIGLMLAEKCYAFYGLDMIDGEIKEAKKVIHQNKLNNALYSKCEVENTENACSCFLKGKSVASAIVNLNSPYGKSRDVMIALRNLSSIQKVAMYGSFTKEFQSILTHLTRTDKVYGKRFLPMQARIVSKSPTIENSFEIVILFKRETLIDSPITPSVKVEQKNSVEENSCDDIEVIEVHSNVEVKDPQQCQAPTSRRKPKTNSRNSIELIEIDSDSELESKTKPTKSDTSVFKKPTKKSKLGTDSCGSQKIQEITLNSSFEAESSSQCKIESPESDSSVFLKPTTRAKPRTSSCRSQKIQELKVESSSQSEAKHEKNDSSTFPRAITKVETQHDPKMTAKQEIQGKSNIQLKAELQPQQLSILENENIYNMKTPPHKVTYHEDIHNMQTPLHCPAALKSKLASFTNTGIEKFQTFDGSEFKVDSGGSYLMSLQTNKLLDDQLGGKELITEGQQSTSHQQTGSECKVNQESLGCQSIVNVRLLNDNTIQTIKNDRLNEHQKPSVTYTIKITSSDESSGDIEELDIYSTGGINSISIERDENITNVKQKCSSFQPSIIVEQMDVENTKLNQVESLIKKPKMIQNTLIQDTNLLNKLRTVSPQFPQKAESSIGNVKLEQVKSFTKMPTMVHDTMKQDNLLEKPKSATVQRIIEDESDVKKMDLDRTVVSSEGHRKIGLTEYRNRRQAPSDKQMEKEYLHYQFTVEAKPSDKNGRFHQVGAFNEVLTMTDPNVYPNNNQDSFKSKRKHSCLSDDDMESKSTFLPSKGQLINGSLSPTHRWQQSSHHSKSVERLSSEFKSERLHPSVSSPGPVPELDQVEVLNPGPIVIDLDAFPERHEVEARKRRRHSASHKSATVTTEHQSLRQASHRSLFKPPIPSSVNESWRSVCPKSENHYPRYDSAGHTHRQTSVPRTRKPSWDSSSTSESRSSSSHVRCRSPDPNNRERSFHDRRHADFEEAMNQRNIYPRIRDDFKSSRSVNRDR